MLVLAGLAVLAASHKKGQCAEPMDFRAELNERMGKDIHQNNMWPAECVRVKRLPRTESEFHMLARRRGHPVIFENAWELFGPRIPSWRNTSYLTEKFGNVQLDASYFDAQDPNERFGITPVDGGKFILQPFHKQFKLADLVAFDSPTRLAFAEQFNFIDYEEFEPEKVDAEGMPLPRARSTDTPGMAADWQAPAFIGGFDPSSVNLWLGRVREGVHRVKESPTHYDPNDNLMLQLRGNKTFHMYHAHDAPNIYPHYMRLRSRKDPDDPSSVQEDQPDDLHDGPSYSVQDNFSPINPRKLDFDAFPRSRRARPITCTVAPGEALFMPAFTWHNVVNRGEKSEVALDDGLNIGVNVWWPGEARLQILFESLMALLQGGRLDELWNEGAVDESVVSAPKLGDHTPPPKVETSSVGGGALECES
jgi:hypothetical protein